MTWTYDGSAAASSGLSFVRLRIGDTSSGSPQFTDEEIESLLTLEGNKYAAAAAAAESLGAKYSRNTDKTVGRLRIAQQQAAQSYFTMAKRLRAEAASHVGGYAGGISVSDKQTDEENTDRVDPAFYVEQFDNPGVTTDLSTE